MEKDIRLTEQALSPDDVDALYRALLGRAAENRQIWTEVSALDAIIAITTSGEARRKAGLEPSGSGRYRITEGHNGVFVTLQADTVIGAAIRQNGSFEESDVGEALAVLARLGRDVPRKRFVDVGANIGTHTLAAFALGFEQAICIEPDDTNARLLRANLALNGVDHRCTVVQAASSSASGAVTFELSPDNFGDHRVKAAVLGRDLYAEGERASTSVNAVRLDEVIGSTFGDPCQADLVWIDTQGHEGHVLKGAPALVGSDVPLVLEFWPYGLQRSGGFEMLKAALSERRAIYDLRQSVSGGPLNECSQDGLDSLFARLKAKHDHTDLLVL